MKQKKEEIKKPLPNEMIRPHQVNKKPIVQKDSLTEVELPETDKEMG